jgi:threonine synthase
MMFAIGLKCTICQETFPYNDELFTCPTCGEKGILDVIYDYDEMSKVVTREYFSTNSNYSMLRYQALMTINDIEGIQPLQVGWTPVYKGTESSKKTGMSNLYFKDDGQNPTQSLKDRASLVACLHALALNKKVVACSSTGNAASSLAGNAARLGLESVIFVPQRSPIGKQSQIMAYGATLIRVGGDYKDTFNLSKEVIQARGYYNRNAAINPHLVEGKKTVAFEIAEQMAFQAIDNVFVSVGDGCTIAGVYKGFKEFYTLGLIPKIPRIFGIQSSGCCPFVDAFLGHHDIHETAENTIADSIAVGIPRNPVKGMRAVTESDGQYISVSDADILSAQQHLATEEGLFAEPAGATAYAGLLKALKKQLLSKEDTTVVLITGNGLKDTKTYLEHTSPPHPIEPSILLDAIHAQEDSLQNILARLQTEKVKNNE